MTRGVAVCVFLGGVLFALLAAACAKAGDVSTLPQNWDDEQRDQFWFTSQGSRLLPYAWFLALEAPDTSLFRSDSNLSSFGYLPTPASLRNRHALPIGFVRDLDGATNESYIGLTCAACHTNRIRAGENWLHIDGAGALADFGAFYAALVRAVTLTASDEERFRRFAHLVLGDGMNEQASAELRTKLRAKAAELSQEAANNRPASPAGHARLDAFGEIYNAVLEKGLGVKDNAASPSAPVSYPFLWDTPQHDRVQWNGSASNAGLGDLVRNTGEVLGVFGSLELKPGGFASSARIAGLEQLENLLESLWSPRWPDVLGAVNPDGPAYARGSELYEDLCDGCHTPIDRSDPARVVTAKMIDVGTDAAMHTQFFRLGRTGPLKGKPSPDGGEEIPAATSAIGIVAIGVIGVLTANHAAIEDFDGRLAAFNAVRDEVKPNPAEVRYKARSLNGIWATAPYLHNGSVPTLRQLLARSSDRPAKFYVGSPDFDTVEIGFCYERSCGGTLFDTSLPGNSNVGHEFGAELTDSDKQALVEYLKTL